VERGLEAFDHIEARKTSIGRARYGFNINAAAFGCPEIFYEVGCRILHPEADRSPGRTAGLRRAPYTSLPKPGLSSRAGKRRRHPRSCKATCWNYRNC